MLIAQGRVTVNGLPASVGERVDPDVVDVRIDGVHVTLDPDLVTWLLYKPPGVVTTMDDPQDRPTVASLVPAEPLTRPVGRLDLHSEGLVLMTNDGDLALVVAHPRYEVPKTYHVLVPESVAPRQIAALTQGIELEDGPARAVDARVASAFGDRTIVEIVLNEGRKREIRRMFAALSLPIDRLVRTAIGPISDRTLAQGTHRALTTDEIQSLYRYAKDTEIHA